MNASSSGLATQYHPNAWVVLSGDAPPEVNK